MCAGVEEKKFVSNIWSWGGDQAKEEVRITKPKSRQKGNEKKALACRPGVGAEQDIIEIRNGLLFSLKELKRGGEKIKRGGVACNIKAKKWAVRILNGS